MMAVNGGGRSNLLLYKLTDVLLEGLAIIVHNNVALFFSGQLGKLLRKLDFKTYCLLYHFREFGAMCSREIETLGI